MEVFEIQQHLRKMLSTLADVRHRFKYDVKKLRIMEIDDMLSKDSMWSDACMMHKLMQERSSLHKSIDHLSALEKDIESAIEIIDIANDDDEIHDILLEIGKNLEPWNKQINSLRIASVFNNKEDYLDCFVEINAGAGGTDSQDWVEIMLRMYISWANSKGFKTKISHRMEGDEAGLKQVIFSISGHLAFGYMKFENGIHRLVRLSPFNASNKRQTSFASVFCYPSTDDKIDIKIDEKDLRVDTYRSSGAGGQHVNKTDSAVRITHLLTGIAVQSQNQRSQIQNRAEAMKILKARLYDLELQKLSANRDAVESKKSEIAWSNQIRNYVMHPYQLVKDVRSNYETAQISKILDGDLDDLMESVIMCNI